MGIPADVCAPPSKSGPFSPPLLKSTLTRAFLELPPPKRTQCAQRLRLRFLELGCVWGTSSARGRPSFSLLAGPRWDPPSLWQHMPSGQARSAVQAVPFQHHRAHRYVSQVRAASAERSDMARALATSAPCGEPRRIAPATTASHVTSSAGALNGCPSPGPSTRRACVPEGRQATLAPHPQKMAEAGARNAL